MKNLKQMPGAAMICRPHLAAFLPFRRHPAPGTLLVHLSDIAHPPVLAIPTCTHNGREFKGPPGQVLPPDQSLRPNGMFTIFRWSNKRFRPFPGTPEDAEGTDPVRLRQDR